jgi:Domain of unknown function (DUF2017)
VAARKLVRNHRDGFELRLDDTERDLLRSVIGELRTLLIAENPATDPAVGRLFPPAYPDDLLQNLDFERTAGSGLLAERLKGLDEAEVALSAPRLSEDSLMALMRVVNDLRLVYGTRLDVTEESTYESFKDDRERMTFDLYLWLGWLIENIVGALAGG